MRKGYSSHLAAFLNGGTKIGMLGSSAAHQPPSTRLGPAQSAHREVELWRPFLRRFAEGERKFVHWSFWPSTVFTSDAARDLTQLFTTDKTLQQVMNRTKIWASEEVILPTLVALLGYELSPNPCSYDYVKYRASYTVQQIRAAQSREDVFWVHPVPRRYDDSLRHYIRTSFAHYENGLKSGGAMPLPEAQPESGLLLTWPILAQMKQIEGWLAEEEADLLIAAARMALTKLPQPHSVVEVGSYCGRSTVVLGQVVKALAPDARVYAVDPHDGKVGALDQGIRITPPTLEKLKRNLGGAGLGNLVTIVPTHSWEVVWDKPISLLFIDGLHDYANVARDFHHFETWLAPGAYVAFHDYADYYPGVRTFVNELLKTGQFQRVYCASSMMVVRKTPQSEPSDLGAFQPACPVKAEQHSSSPGEVPSVATATVTAGGPCVSCIMPTADRREFLSQAIKYFQRQDYPNRELDYSGRWRRRRGRLSSPRHSDSLFALGRKTHHGGQAQPGL